MRCCFFSRSVNHTFVHFALVALIGICCCTTAFAAEDAEVITSKPVKRAPIPNFCAELALCFPSLEQLGSRIKEAREAADPVGLACASVELGAAEEVSGKKASLTAKAIADEAAALATRRYEPKELQAVALLTGMKQLNDVAAKASRYHADKKAAADSGERTRGITGSVTVRSKSQFFDVKIYINGSYRGVVGPGRSRKFYVGDYWDDMTELVALDCTPLSDAEWVKEIHSEKSNYVWNLSYFGD